MAVNKINPVYTASRKVNGDSLDASEWNAVSEATAAAQAKCNEIIDGISVRKSGTTAQRPTGDQIYVGFEYYDTDLGKFIYAWDIGLAPNYTVDWRDFYNQETDDPVSVVTGSSGQQLKLRVAVDGSTAYVQKIVPSIDPANAWEHIGDSGVPTVELVRQKVNAKYTKPGTGIPATDLSAAVQASLGRADKILVAGAYISDVITNLESASTQGELTTLRRTISGDKLILFPSVGGYVTAIVTGTRSTFTFEFTYDGVYYEVTGDASDVWSITKQQNLMLVQAYPDIDMMAIVTTGTISSANVTALIAMRSKNELYAQILVSYGDTLVPATVTTYGSGFNMFCFVEGSHGEPIMVHISADPSNSNWTATVTNLYVKPSGGIPATDLASAVRTALTAAGTALQPADLNTLNGKVAALESLVSEDGTPVDTVIDKFNEIVTFLAGITTTDTLAGIIGDISSQIAAKASKSEMSVVAGTGADADKATITLKSGTSATVLTSHQSLSNYYNKTEVDGKIVDGPAGLSEHGKTLSGYAIESEFQRKLVSGTSIKTINGGSVLGNGNLSLVESTSVRTVVVISQSDYDALATKDTNTEYNIIESV